jgi:hypothetical protein
MFRALEYHDEASASTPSTKGQMNNYSAVKTMIVISSPRPDESVRPQRPSALHRHQLSKNKKDELASFESKRMMK